LSSTSGRFRRERPGCVVVHQAASPRRADEPSLESSTAELDRDSPAFVVATKAALFAWLVTVRRATSGWLNQSGLGLSMASSVNRRCCRHQSSRRPAFLEVVGVTIAGADPVTSSRPIPERALPDDR
jgi:hypothetical protein